MKIILKILAGIAILLAGILIYVQFAWNKKYEAAYPEISASKDSAIIARGKYLAFGPAHCGHCHVPMDKIMEVDNGLQPPLSGGWTLKIPPGTFVAPNITPDTETGIGKLTDGEIARTLRYSVGSDGRCIMPFMPFQGMSDEDLTAVISFLRSQQPVKFQQPKSQQPTLLGKAIFTFGLIKPEVPASTPPKSVRIDSIAEYGGYLANSVANCVGCHTNRDMKTGALIGPPFAGGLLMEPEIPGGTFHMTPNLTPDPTGVTANWTEEMFVTRFKKGRVLKESPMPWGAFSRINELELKAIYRYLKSLDPVENKIPKTIFLPGEKLPETK